MLDQHDFHFSQKRWLTCLLQVSTVSVQRKEKPAGAFGVLFGGSSAKRKLHLPVSSKVNSGQVQFFPLFWMVNSRSCWPGFLNLAKMCRAKRRPSWSRSDLQWPSHSISSLVVLREICPRSAASLPPVLRYRWRPTPLPSNGKILSSWRHHLRRILCQMSHHRRPQI